MEFSGTLTFACPNPIRHVAPWQELNGAETNFTRLIYDSLIDLNGRVAADIEAVAGQRTYRIAAVSSGIYSDGFPYDMEDWAPGLRAAIQRTSRGSAEVLEDGSLLVKDIDLISLRDALSSPAAIPFRPPVAGSSLIDTHPCTSGRYYIKSVSSNDIYLQSNPNHAVVPNIGSIRIRNITDPEVLWRLFENREIHIMVLGGDELSRLDGNVYGRGGGVAYTKPANTISMLVAKPGGALADDNLRWLISANIPRAEFCRTFLGPEGEVAYGFSENVRRDESVVPSGGKAPMSPRDIDFIVPPSERTVQRGRWLADQLSSRTGVEVRTVVPSWPDYWRCIGDPAQGDLLWTGIQVAVDDVRYWVKYDLFGRWLPLPRYYDGIRNDIWGTTQKRSLLERAERQLVMDGWVMPLYRHHQSYLVSQQLEGFQIDPADWPLPATGHVAELRWL